MSDVKNGAAAEPYEAPTIEDIPLRAEEQVLRGCKQAHGNGVGISRPNGCTIAGGCLNIGSS